MNLERLRELLGQGLDGELDRPETRRLYRLLSDGSIGRDALEKILNSDEELSALKREIEKADLPENFMGRVMAAVEAEPPLVQARAPKDRAADGAASGFWNQLRAGFTRPRLPATAALGLVGAVAGVLLFAILTSVPATYHLAPRFAFHAPAVYLTSDNARWTHTSEVLPGQSLTVRVTQAPGDDIHLRLNARGNVDITIVHKASNGDSALPYHLTRGGLHYATLSEPVTGDLITIRNNGSAALTVKALSPNPDSLEVRTPPAGPEDI